MLELDFSVFPVIQTERLVLKRITPDHAPDLFRMRTNVDAMRYIDKPPTRSIDEIKLLIKKMEDGINTNETISWGISLLNSDEIIGTIGYHRIQKEHFRAEIGYMLMPEHWKKGIMSEAMKTVIDYGFEKMKLHSIEANINPINEASRQILLKFGFKKEAYFKENFFANGKFLDSEIYSLLK